MTVIPDIDLQSALNQALAMAFPSMPVSWENKTYSPTVGTPYLRAWLLPAETDVVTLGQSPFQQRTGIFQVDVVYPAGSVGKQWEGWGLAKAKAAQVVAAFTAGTKFTYNALEVTCEKAWPSSGREEGNSWYHIPVNVRYRCESNA